MKFKEWLNTEENLQEISFKDVLSRGRKMVLGGTAAAAMALGSGCSTKHPENCAPAKNVAVQTQPKTQKTSNPQKLSSSQSELDRLNKIFANPSMSMGKGYVSSLGNVEAYRDSTTTYYVTDKGRIFKMIPMRGVANHARYSELDINTNTWGTPRANYNDFVKIFNP